MAASGVVEAHLGAADGAWLVLSRLSSPWGQDTRFVERFGQHARALAELHAPELAPLQEFGTGGDGIWFAEKTGDGEPLRALMASKTSRLAVHECIAIVERVAQGLIVLHQAGLAHGDVSASSVFITPQGAVQLLRPGLAVVAGSHPSRGPARSEPHALAPEQLQGMASAATDVFRLGLLLLEMLTGKSLFVANDPTQVLALAQRFQGVPAAAFAGVAPQLTSALGWMMHRSPDERPAAPEVPNALEMASAALGLSTGDTEIARAYRRLLADRTPVGRLTELRVAPPRVSVPPPQVPRPSAPLPTSTPTGAVLGRIGTRRVSHEALEAVRAQVPTTPGMREAMVGEHLLKVGKLSAAQLSEVQQRSVMLQLTLSETAVIDGVLSEDEVVEAIAAVTRTAFISSLQLSQLDGAPLHLLPPHEAERLVALPVAERGGVLTVAVLEPLDQATLDGVKGATGRQVQLVRAGDRALRDAIARLYQGESSDSESWLERGPNTQSEINAEGGLELTDDATGLELEGRPAARARSISANGLDEGQARLLEVTLAGLGPHGVDAAALMSLCGEIARRMSGSESDVDKARFVSAAVAVHNVLAGQKPWATPQLAAFDARFGPLALPVKGLVPAMFDGLKAMPDDLVGLAVVCGFALANVAGAVRPRLSNEHLAALRKRRLPSVALEALSRVLASG